MSTKRLNLVASIFTVLSQHLPLSDFRGSPPAIEVDHNVLSEFRGSLPPLKLVTMF